MPSLSLSCKGKYSKINLRSKNLRSHTIAGHLVLVFVVVVVRKVLLNVRVKASMFLWNFREKKEKMEKSNCLGTRLN